MCCSRTPPGKPPLGYIIIHLGSPVIRDRQMQLIEIEANSGQLARPKGPRNTPKRNATAMNSYKRKFTIRSNNSYSSWGTPALAYGLIRSSCSFGSADGPLWTQSELQVTFASAIRNWVKKRMLVLTCDMRTSRACIHNHGETLRFLSPTWNRVMPNQEQDAG